MTTISAWMMENTLFLGDNLDILKSHIKDESIDLIYLDPPFLTGRKHMLRNQQSPKTPAFTDNWTWNEATQRCFLSLLQSEAPKVKIFLESMINILGKDSLMSYLVMMTPRLVELQRVLKVEGTIYLHCDPKVAHYLKIMMDVVFGATHFQNELIWSYESGGASKKRFSRKHDTIFWYSKSENWQFHGERIAVPRTPAALHRAQNPKNARISIDSTTKNPNDVLAIQHLNPMAKERLGYPTQKPEALLEMLIKAASNEGDMVLDPFCGSGTTLAVAHRLGRKWLGIDCSELAIEMSKERLGIQLSMMF